MGPKEQLKPADASSSTRCTTFGADRHDGRYAHAASQVAMITRWPASGLETTPQRWPTAMTGDPRAWDHYLAEHEERPVAELLSVLRILSFRALPAHRV